MDRRPSFDLETALDDLAGAIRYPPPPDLVGPVVAAIQGSAPRALGPSRWRVAIAAAAAVVLVAAVAIVASPTARHAVADWLGIDGIRIEFDESPPGPAPGDDLALGRKVTLGEARSEVDFDVVVPTALGEPDGVFLNRNVGDGEVSMTYAPEEHLPESGHTGVGALFAQFEGDLTPEAVKKVIETATVVRPVEVDGAEGYWIAGKPHLLYIQPDGGEHVVTSRLAGNTLIWQREGVAYRLEAEVSLPEALAFARSAR